MATIKQAKAALVRAATTGRIRNREVNYTPSSYVAKRYDEGREKLHACAYGVLALNAGLSYGDILLLSHLTNSEGVRTRYENALYDKVNQTYGLDPETGRRMEELSDEKGWEAAIDFLEEVH